MIENGLWVSIERPNIALNEGPVLGVKRLKTIVGILFQSYWALEPSMKT